MAGVARRAWVRNENSITTSMEYNQTQGGLDHITLPFIPKDNLIKNIVLEALTESNK